MYNKIAILHVHKKYCIIRYIAFIEPSGLSMALLEFYIFATINAILPII